MKWADWKQLTDLDGVPTKPGIYKICKKKNGRPYPTQRFLKEDSDGIIYIGEGKNVRERLLDFRRALNTGQSHIASDRIYVWNQENKIDYEIEDFEYIYREIPSNLAKSLDKDELIHYLEKEEEDELENYESEYGQFPPLNRDNPSGTQPWFVKKT